MESTEGVMIMQLSKEEFVDWLHSKGYDIIGHRRTSSSCPIANYVKSKMNTEDVWVSSSIRYRAEDGEVRRIELPQWAGDFIYAVDESLFYTYPYVTTIEALEIIRG